MWRRQRFVVSILVPIILAILFLATFAIKFDELAEHPAALAIYGAGVAVIFVFASVLSYFYIRWRMTANVVSAVRKLLAEGTNRGITGWREMELVNHRLNVKLELVESSYDLRAIEKIVNND